MVTIFIIYIITENDSLEKRRGIEREMKAGIS